MFEKLKGTLILQAYMHFNKLPGASLRGALEEDGWQFKSLSGAAPLGISDTNNTIIHPDGKPLSGAGAPGYVRGDVIDKKVYNARIHDFKNALVKAL